MGKQKHTPEPWSFDLSIEEAALLRDSIADGDETSEITLSVGPSKDDEGNEKYGLRLHWTEYPEEGCVPLCECTAPRNTESALMEAEAEQPFFRVAGEAIEQLNAMTKQRDDLLTAQKSDSAFILLEDLVDALGLTYWSSWQTTAKFDKELNAAKEFIASAKESK